MSPWSCCMTMRSSHGHTEGAVKLQNIQTHPQLTPPRSSPYSRCPMTSLVMRLAASVTSKVACWAMRSAARWVNSSTRGTTCRQHTQQAPQVWTGRPQSTRCVLPACLGPITCAPPREHLPSTIHGRLWVCSNCRILQVQQWCCTTWCHVRIWRLHTISES